MRLCGAETPIPCVPTHATDVLGVPLPPPTKDPLLPTSDNVIPSLHRLRARLRTNPGAYTLQLVLGGWTS
ncbi:hypothetical protein QJS10_CPB18g00645 [Acorus calamus]|uniref:Uncharacterized protein n=1 Tax=Acorus calamus TaxID=4465 RepID=A0AAV9CSM4_ACOCL|nr:hypothetical protein QJS10_CPB18g00645 [Acorus calamus]